MILEGKRIADEDVYLNEDRFNEPKLVFTLIGDRIANEAFAPGARILDVGCATGEMLYYLMGRFREHSFTGLDVSEPLIERARERNPEVEFIIGSVLDPAMFAERRFDAVTATGLLSIFDNPESVIGNLLACTREGGSVIISAFINVDPIDTIIRYRRTEGDPGEWETGWNVWSKNTIERILKESDDTLSWEWQPWDPPYRFAKGKDPMRSWTIQTEHKEHQRVNGAGQLLNGHLIHIRIDKVGR